MFLTQSPIWFKTKRPHNHEGVDGRPLSCFRVILGWVICLYLLGTMMQLPVFWFGTQLSNGTLIFSCTFVSPMASHFTVGTLIFSLEGPFLDTHVSRLLL